MSAKVRRRSMALASIQVGAALSSEKLGSPQEEGGTLGHWALDWWAETERRDREGQWPPSLGPWMCLTVMGPATVQYR